MYQELNNREYRHTCNVLSLSFVSDDFEAPNEARDVCEDIPSHYIAASDKQTNALGSTFLELSWDKTDPNRMELCQRAFNENQLQKMDLDAYLQDDDAITDAGFDTDYPVTEYDTDTPDKKVLIKRRARNRYKEILAEFKQMEKTLNDSSDGGGASGVSDGEETDRENLFGINVGKKKEESDEESEDIEDGIKAFRQRLQQKQSKAMEQAKLAQLNVDNLSSTSEEEEKEEVDGDMEETFDIDEEENKLNDWIDTQQRLKASIRKSAGDEMADSDDGNEDDSGDEPLVVDGDMHLDEMNDPYFKGVHDDSYMHKAEPLKKKRRMNGGQKVEVDEEMTKKQKIKERAMLEMMMATGENDGYDPENTGVDHEQLSKNLNKRLKRNWRLRWLIKKAVKRKLAERDDFEFNANDSRFNSMIDDPDFAMDPTSTSFRNTKVMKGLLEQTRKRRLNKWKKKGMSKGGWNKKLVKRKDNKESAASIDHMAVIESLKIKSAKIPKLKDGQKRRIDIRAKLKQKGLSSFNS